MSALEAIDDLAASVIVAPLLQVSMRGSPPNACTQDVTRLDCPTGGEVGEHVLIIRKGDDGCGNLPPQSKIFAIPEKPAGV